MSRERGDSRIIVGCAVVWILGSLWFIYTTLGNPLDELALIRHAITAPARLVDTYVDEETDEGVYSFHATDGREYATLSRTMNGDVSNEADVEYLPDDPNTNRVKGEGCRTVTEWLWRKIVLGSLILIVLVGAGVGMFMRGLRDLRRSTAKVIP